MNFFRVCKEFLDWAWVYFVSFYIITTEIMINLFILVLLNQFDEFSSNAENPLHTFKENLEKFRKNWSLLTVQNEGKKIHKKYMLKLFKAMKPPLGNFFHFNFKTIFFRFL